MGHVKQYSSGHHYRRTRMQGYNACWVPGTDHASIAGGQGCFQIKRTER